MSIAGTYCVYQMATMTENGLEMKDITLMMESDDPDEQEAAENMQNLLYKVTEENDFIELMRIPDSVSDEELEAAVKEEGIEIIDRCMVRGRKKIKEYNGELYVAEADEDLSTTGENGEDLHSFKKIEVKESEGLIYQFGAVLKKMD